MPASAQRVAAEKSETRPAKSKSGGSTELWDLPEWNLDDLYAGLEHNPLDFPALNIFLLGMTDRAASPYYYAVGFNVR